jgi:hypothetical protein
VRSAVTTTRPGETTTVVRQDTARAQAPTIQLGDDGFLRFVSPLRCTAEQQLEIERSETVSTDPNMATFIVGMIVTAVGAVGALRGISSDDASGSGYTWLGAGGVVVGLPLAIGPWIGNGSTDVDLGRETRIKGTTEAPCGDRPVAARTALVTAAGISAWGTVDASGRFEVSPFTFVDAFASGKLPSLSVLASLTDDAGGKTVIEGVIEATTLSAARDVWLREAGIDARVETLRKVPQLTAGKLSVTRLKVGGQPMLRLQLPLANDGPGDAWQVRGIVSASHTEVDARVMYVGHIPPGGAVDAELVIPLSTLADGDLAGADVSLTLALHDAHDTSPSSPVRFRGKLP